MLSEVIGSAASLVGAAIGAVIVAEIKKKRLSQRNENPNSMVEELLEDLGNNIELLRNTGIKLDNQRAYYDAEDAIESFEYHKKKRLRMHRLLPCCFPRYRKKDVEELTCASKKIRELLDGREQGSNDDTRSEDQDWRKTTARKNTAPVPFLLHDDLRRRILDRLNDAAGDRKLSVVSIFGTGGVGKTELVRAAYNNLDRAEHFEKVWVHAPKKFDVKMIIIQIIQGLAPKKSLPSYEDLQRRSKKEIEDALEHELKDKKVLIVLDDVWEVCDWDVLCSFFEYAKPGSKIVVTTQLESLARRVATTEPIELDVLETVDEYWELFKAFSDWNAAVEPSQETREKLLNKFGGSPLAASQIGPEMKYRSSENDWTNMLQRKLGVKLENRDTRGGIVSVLKLCYEHLPVHLRQCYLSCALFPKNYSLDKKQLLQIWLALGFVPPQRPHDDNLIVYDLAERSFFRNSRRSPEGRPTFEIHAVLRELADLISFGEFFRLEDDSQESIPQKALHLYVTAGNLCNISNRSSEIEKLRSLVVKGEQYLENDRRFKESLKEVLKSAKRLRLLILSVLPDGKLPEAIGKLRLLRYLEFPCTESQKVPKSFRKLNRLQCVYLKKRDDPEAAVESITNFGRDQGASIIKKIEKGITSLFQRPRANNPQA